MADAPAPAAGGEAAVPAAAKKPASVGGLTPAMLERAVKQIEFYFSDSNLPRDKFMLEHVRQNAEGYVDIGLIATFARMREILKVRARVSACSVAAASGRAARPRPAAQRGRSCRGGSSTLTLGARASCRRRCLRLAFLPPPCPPYPTRFAPARRRCRVRASCTQQDRLASALTAAAATPQ